MHIRGARQASGDVLVTWVRRGWDAADIPLDEPEECYRVKVVDGGAVMRTVEVVQPAFTYLSADETADFGVAQTNLSWRIRQMGRAVPLGIPADATISI